MPKIDLYLSSGKKSTPLTVPAEIFNVKAKPILIAQAVRVYLANQRRAAAKTKGRGQVIGSGRKIYRQKGTGRARHGDAQAPIFVGGGIAHGPRGNQNFSLKISKKMSQKALFAALTIKLKDGQMIAVKGLEKLEPKTKLVAAVLTNLKLDRQKVSLVLSGTEKNLLRAGANITNLKLLRAASLNTYDVVSGGKLVFLPESIEKLKTVFLHQ